MVPRATFKISGEIDDFLKVDNLYKAMKTQGVKLLKNWTIEVSMEFTESETETP